MWRWSEADDWYINCYGASYGGTVVTSSDNVRGVMVSSMSDVSGRWLPSMTLSNIDPAGVGCYGGTMVMGCAAGGGCSSSPAVVESAYDDGMSTVMVIGAPKCALGGVIGWMEDVRRLLYRLKFGLRTVVTIRGLCR